MIHRRSAVSVVILSLYAAVGYGQSIRKVPEYGKLPLNFEANLGQTDGRVKFLAHGVSSGHFFCGWIFQIPIHGINKLISRPLA